jgi:hypothetical protein
VLLICSRDMTHNSQKASNDERIGGDKSQQSKASRQNRTVGERFQFSHLDCSLYATIK